MLKNPYENFDVGIFRNGMSAFCEDLKEDSFDSIFKNNIGNDACINGTLYVPTFEDYVDKSIKNRFDKLNILAQKYGDLAEKIDNCNKSYEVYKDSYNYFHGINQYLDEKDENGQLKVNPSWYQALTNLLQAEADFNTNKRFVDLYCVGGGD